MKIVVLHLYDGKSKWLNLFVEEYRAKLQKFCEVIALKPKAARARGTQEIRKKEDSDQLLSSVQKEDFVVLCDERGRSLSSIEFAKKVNDWLVNSNKKIIFIIGGPYGASEELQKRANYKLQLSTLVMNHHVALSVLVEQVYRSYAILNNLPYHNE